MTPLPFLLSVPHAGLDVPPAVAPYCVLTGEQIAKDGDEQARPIYALAGEVVAFVTTEVARAIVDMNRAEDDRRKDGVVKTHTCFDEPVYDPFPPEELVERLLREHYRPYHARLAAPPPGVRLGLDCHTMCAVGPPIGPDPGVERPYSCLSNGDDTTCSRSLLEELAGCFERAFGRAPALNHPFRGGHIVRAHGGPLPWIQVELSRAKFLPVDEKRAAFLAAIRDFGGRLLRESRASRG